MRVASEAPTALLGSDSASSVSSQNEELRLGVLRGTERGLGLTALVE
jgi:hypothetical protein